MNEPGSQNRRRTTQTTDLKFGGAVVNLGRSGVLAEEEQKKGPKKKEAEDRRRRRRDEEKRRRRNRFVFVLCFFFGLFLPGSDSAIVSASLVGRRSNGRTFEFPAPRVACRRAAPLVPPPHFRVLFSSLLVIVVVVFFFATG